METAFQRRTAADQLMQAAADAYQRERFVEAEQLARQALLAEPSRADILNACGVFLRAQDRSGEALAFYRQAVAVEPMDAGIWSNYGNALKDVKEIEPALFCHRRALALQPDSVVSWHNLGIALREGNRDGEAIEAHGRALALDPDNRGVRWDRAMSYLNLGNYRDGWVDYDIRIKTKLGDHRVLPGKKWAGEAFRGQTLLILREQGFGDTIWASRYLKQVKALGGTVIIECLRPVMPLIQAIGAADSIIAPEQALPDADWHCHICSLPGIFTQDRAEIPSAPYIVADDLRRHKFADIVKLAGKRLKVGIVWSGSTSFKLNGERAATLEQFLEYFDLPGVQLFSLQKGPPREQLNPRFHKTITDLDGHIADFADTAAAVSMLDLVIMTDSAVAHLTGAMGKPVWVLLNYAPYWLWLRGGERTPWYPSAKLFRPSAWASWHEVFSRVRAELMSTLHRS